MPLLSVTDLSFTYPDGQAALRNVSFSVAAGEHVAVLGMNGSGKSTLARLVCGLLAPCSGSVALDGDCLCGIVFQSPDDQIVASVVESDTAFGPQNLGFSAESVRAVTRERLSAVGLWPCRGDRTLELSQGQKQRLAFAGITAMRPGLLVLDEVTSMLDEASRAEVLSLVDEAVSSGCTVLHVTHDLDEAARAERILALDDGRVVFDGPPGDFVRRPELAPHLFGTESPASSACSAQDASHGSRPGPETDCALFIDGITFSYSARDGSRGRNASVATDSGQCVFRDFSLGLRRGTLTALTGASGSGKSTLLELASGLLVPQSGRILGRGAAVLALQDSERALFEEFAADDVAFGPRNQGLKGRALAERVRCAMDAAGLPFAEFAERRTQGLSGGQKRKLSLAGIIALDAEVLLFDEPTAGLDPKSRRKVLSVLQGLAFGGRTVVFSTHREDEAACADRVVRLECSRPALVAHDTDSDPPRDSGGIPCGSGPESLSAMEARGGTGLLSFLRGLGGSFSQGSKARSPVRLLPAAAKYAVFLLLFLVSFVTRSVVQASVAALLALAYAVCARYPLGRLARSLLKVLPWILLFLALQLLFLPAPDDDAVLFRLGFVTVTGGMLADAALMFLHLLSALVCVAVFVYSADERDVLDGLAAIVKPLALCGIPVRHAVLVAGIVFRFVPMLAAEAALIVKVQIIRGGLGDARGLAAKVRCVLPLFVPLFIRTLRRADSLADALTARHYS